MKRYRIIIWLFVCILTAWVFASGLVIAEEGQEERKEPLEELSLYAQAAVLMDADSGRILYGKNAYTPLAMASTTKIMTCIIALEYADPQTQMEVSAYAAGMPKVKLYVKKGETYLLKDLLYSLMLESHNDTAAVIAENIGRSMYEEVREGDIADASLEESQKAVASFASLMNQKAGDIGCRDTWFITPNGLDATQTIHMPDGSDVVKEHSTTAADLARMMSYCIGISPKKESFLEITRTSAYSFAANGRSYSCNNHNAFLNMMDGALSGKTGFTNKAGYCYVGSLTRDDRTFVVALLACGWPNHKTYKWSDTRELMEYGLEHYAYKSFGEIPVGLESLAPIPVTGGCSDLLGDTAYVKAVAQEESQGNCEGLLLREDESIELRYTLEKQLKAPVAEGAIVGRVEYMVGDIPYRTILLVTDQEVKAIDLFWCISQIWNRFVYIF